MNINERLRFVITTLQLNNNSFAKALGVNPVVTHNIISGRQTKPSYELLEKILLTYDNINADWLMCGRGDMIRDKTNKNYKSLAAVTPNDTAIDILKSQLTEVNHVNRELLQILKQQSSPQ